MSNRKRPNFYETDKASEVKAILVKMQTDLLYATGSTYSANAEKHPDHLITFVEKHMEYLNTHPDVNPDQYVANLRIITKLR
jgi:hypothetical protein